MKLAMLKPQAAAIDVSLAKRLPKEAEAHYATPEHRAWARQVIERAHGRCQGKACGRTGVRLFADHIVERRDGGASLDVRNGQALCGSCHTRKTTAERAKRMRA